MTDEAQDPVISEHLAPEYAFGSPLSTDQLVQLRAFAVKNYCENWDDVPDSSEAYAEQLASLGETYTPELGFNILRALSQASLYPKGVQNDPEQLMHVAETEEAFQTVLASSVVQGYNAAVKGPLAYRALVGSDQLKVDIQKIVSEAPQDVLGSIETLEDVLDPVELEEIVTNAYDALLADESKKYISGSVTEKLITIVGKERVVTDTQRLIAEDRFFGSSIYSGDVVKAVNLGIVPFEQGIGIGLGQIKDGAGFSGFDFDKMIQQVDDPDKEWVKLRAKIYDIFTDPKIPPDLVGERLSSYVTSYNPGYDAEFAQKLINRVREVHGDIVILPSLVNIAEAFGEELVTSVIDNAIATLELEVDKDRASEIARALLYQRSRLDYTSLTRVYQIYAESAPEDFIDFSLRKHGSEMTKEESELVRGLFLDSVSRLDVRDLARNISNIVAGITDEDGKIIDDVKLKLQGLDGVGGLNISDIRQFVGDDQLKTIFVNIMNCCVGDRIYDVEETFNKAVTEFGFEAAKELFAEQIATRADVVAQILRGNQMMFSTSEVTNMVRFIVEEGKLPGFMSQLNHLAYRLPREELISLLDEAVNQTPSGLLQNLSGLVEIIGQEKAEGLINKVLYINPAIVLRNLNYLPESIRPETQKVIDFMEKDERISFAPKYFKKTIRRLLKSEETTAFQVMSLEAGGVYEKINHIRGIKGGEAMLLRIKDSMSKSSERAELDSLSLAQISVMGDARPDDIRNVNDAKLQTVGFLNNELGLDIPETLESVAALEKQIGNLVPLALYTLNTRPENRAFLSEVVGSIEAGKYKQWRYGSLDKFIEEGAMPSLTEQQYTIWQENTTAEMSNVVANDASSVAHKVREVVKRGLLNNPAIQKLSNVGDPVAMIIDIKTEMAQIGRSIAEVHRGKSSGEISSEEVSDQVVELERQKSELEFATNIIRLSQVSPEEIAAGVLFNERGMPTKASIEQVIKQIVDRNGDEALDVFGQLQEIIEAYRSAATTDIGNIYVTDSDDFQTTIEIGANPIGSCQHYEHGIQNSGLVGYFEPSTKIVAVKNERGRLVARSVARLASTEDGMTVMVLEPTYMSEASDDIEKSIVRHAKAKAERMGIDVYVKGADGRDDIMINGQRAPALYSDIFGGLREKDTVYDTRNRYKLVKAQE